MPPLVCIFKFVAPAGTVIEKYRDEPKFPEIFISRKRTTVFSVSKMAVTLTLLVPAGMVQLLVPVQAPLQPANVLPLAAWAVRVTALVLAKLADAPEQSCTQLKPLGLLLTLPVPVPILPKVTRRFVLGTPEVTTQVWDRLGGESMSGVLSVTRNSTVFGPASGTR